MNDMDKLASPSPRKKFQVTEIPGIRYRFHERIGCILNHMFEKEVKTTRREHAQFAARLGLKAGDWDWQNTYFISSSDLVEAAKKKEDMRRDAAATLIATHWLASRRVRNEKLQEMRRNRAAGIIQYWWRRLYMFILPIQKKARRRLMKRRAAEKIQALFKGKALRFKLRLELECHHMKYQLAAITSRFDVIPADKLIRLQAIARGGLARRLVGRAREEQAARAAAACLPTSVEGDDAMHGEVPFQKADGERRDNYRGRKSHHVRGSVFGRHLMVANMRPNSTTMRSARPQCPPKEMAYDSDEDDDLTCASTRPPSTARSIRSPAFSTPTPPPGARPRSRRPDQSGLQRPASSCADERPSPGRRSNSSCPDKRSPSAPCPQMLPCQPSVPFSLQRARTPTWSPLQEEEYAARALQHGLLEPTRVTRVQNTQPR